MSKHLFNTLFILITGLSFHANAQYFDATHRQTDQEIQQIKKEKIRMATLSVSDDGNEAPYSITRYDTGGRVTLIANTKHHEHFRYDLNGRMVYWLDSANDGRRFEKFEYQFGYDGSNLVNSYTGPKTISKFGKAANGDITEEVLKNGLVIEKRTYSYTAEGKPVLEMFRDTGGKQVYMHKINYNKYGDVASEVLVNNLKNCKGDSLAVINAYDSKGRIIQKQKFMTSFSCDTRVPNAPVEKKFVSETTSYFYDARGRLTSESTSSNDPAHGGKKEYQYNDAGMVTKELNVDGKGKSKGSLIYRYYYYTRKK